MAKRFGNWVTLAFAVLLACPVVPALAQANGPGSQFDLAFWQAVAASEDAAQYEAYLAQYPQGTFAPIARLKIAALRGSVPVLAPLPIEAPQPVVAAAPAPAAPPPAALPASLPSIPAPIVSPPPPVIAVAVAAPPSDGRAELLARAGAIESGAAPAAAAIILPSAPRLASVPQVPIPPTFCSALARNAYHDDVYRPARRVAQENNRASIAYLRELQALYDVYEPSRDFERMNIIADAAQAYEPIADDTYEVTVTYDSLFDRLMAVRIVDCGAAQ